jgi:Zn-dependent alcohol dehydrogenase
MPQTVKGVIARSKGAPVELVDVVVPDPGPGEAVVVVQACGVCHTDLHYREGGINDDFPFLLGHEAAGVVEAVGEGVTDVAPGDFVILNWRAVCGNCRACRQGQAAVLLRHPQRHAEDDADRRHRALAGPRHRRLHREDARRGGPVHQGRPEAARRRGACSAAA